MKVLIDTNVLLTYLSGREDRYAPECARIVRLCAEEKIEGVIALHSLSTVWYVTRKAPDDVRRGFIRELCTLMTVSGASTEAILSAVDDTDFADFEDALQDLCAEQAECELIVTANIRDYAGHSRVEAVTPDELLKRIQ